MIIQESKTRHITLDSSDLKQAIIMYLKGRGEREIQETDIELNPVTISASISITETTQPKEVIIKTDK